MCGRLLPQCAPSDGLIFDDVVVYRATLMLVGESRKSMDESLFSAFINLGAVSSEIVSIH
jgi:hypothetical protein